MPLPAVRAIVRRAAATRPPQDRGSREAATLALWRDAGYREERHAAIALTGQPRFAPYQDPDTMPVYEELVVTGASWDLVDEGGARRSSARSAPGRGPTRRS